MPQGVQSVAYSRVLPGTEDATHGPIHRSVIESKNPYPPDPRDPSHPYTGLARPFCESIYHCFQLSAKTFANKPCLGVQPIVGGQVRPFEWQTYAQIAKRMEHVASGMIHLDLLPRVGRHRMLALYMKNSIEWVIAEHAGYAFGAIIVALYDTLGADSTEFILNQTELPTIVCTIAELKKFIALRPRCPHVNNVVLCGASDDEVEDSARAVGLRVVSFADVEAEGKKHPTAPQPPMEEDIATIMYTSGTTGDPKGVVITHRALISQCQAQTDYCELSGIHFSPTTSYLSYLPLAHIMERGAVLNGLRFGGHIGISQGNPLKIIDDLKALRPTVFASVPRLLNRVYDQIMAKMRQAPKLARFLFFTALNAKLRNLNRHGKTRHPIWDKMFRKIAASLGLDRCELIISGSAPLSPDVLSFWRIVFPAVFSEGYGQTETTSGICSSSITDFSPGYVGGPATSAEIRLESVPEMGYLVSDRFHGDEQIPCIGRGEICIRGPILFNCYFKLPEKTAEAIDCDGWLHTGDIGLWSPLGQLKIIDRKKNIFKLSQGEYVAPEKIEIILQACPSVAQIFVTGDSFHSHLVAVVVPEDSVIKQVAVANGMSIASSLRELCDQPHIKKHVLKELDDCCLKAKLAGYERIKQVYLHHELFSVDNDLLTPTFKLKRADAQRKFKKQIDEMYELSGDMVAGKNITQQC